MDYVRSIFCILVCFLSCLVFKYRGYYNRSEVNPKRFYFLLFLFVVRIFFIIFRPNFISVLLGWDGLGLVSYLLVIYYFSRISRVSGVVTILINRVGDAFLILLIGFILDIFGGDMMHLCGLSKGFYGVIILICCITKRSQIPFVA